MRTSSILCTNSAQLTQNQRLSHPRDCHEISILILSEFKQLTSSNPPEIKRKPKQLTSSNPPEIKRKPMVF